jgi:methyl-branched lipid omega-hydroxylase
VASTHVGISASDIKLSEPEFWRQPAQAIDDAFTVLRREAPISYHQEVAYPPVIEGGPGYWALTKYDDITVVTKDEDRFCNGQGITIWDWPPALAEAFSHMLAQDDPEHARLRRIVRRAFTPGAMERMQVVIQREATRAVDDIADRGEIEFVSELASRFPVRVICEMLGVPAEHHEMVAANTTEVVRVADPTLIAGAPDPAKKLESIVGAGMALAGLMMELGEDRRANPRDDIVSKLINAEVEGEALDTVELTRFFILLAVGGADTTRAALSHGMIALSEHPDEKRRWQADLDRYAETAPDEIIRWATPLIHFRRTATQDLKLGDAEIKAGDKVVLFYRSGNRDEDVFTDPNRFDVGRPTSPSHLSFGGRGIHHCLGQHLARTQIRAIFREVLRRLPDIEVVGEPVYTGGSQVHGLEEIRCRFTPESR